MMGHGRLRRRRPRRGRPDHAARRARAGRRPTSCCSTPSPTRRCASWHRGRAGSTSASAASRHATGQTDDQRAAGAACARRHALVVRLKGGDPSVFGRLEEELEALAARRHRVRGGARRHRSAGRGGRDAAPADAPRPRPQRQPVSTAMTQRRRAAGHAQRRHRGLLHGRHASSARLSRRLLRRRLAGRHAGAAWSRAPAGPTSWHSDHTRRRRWPQAAVLHAGRPTVVTVGARREPRWPATKTLAVDAASCRGRPTASP